MIAVVILLRNYRILFRYTYIFGLAGILLLLLPFVPGHAHPGRERGGLGAARRRVRLPAG